MAAHLENDNGDNNRLSNGTPLFLQALQSTVAYIRMSTSINYLELIHLKDVESEEVLTIMHFTIPTY